MFLFFITLSALKNSFRIEIYLYEWRVQVFSYIIYIPHNIHSCMRYPTTKAKKERKISLFLFIQNPIKGFMRDSHSYFIQSSHSYLFSLEIIITGSLYKIYVNVFIFSLCLSSEISHKGTLELFFFCTFAFHSLLVSSLTLMGTIFVSMWIISYE